MANSVTVQSIQDCSNARANFCRALAVGAVFTGLTGVVMPVLLYRGHSLAKTVALAVLVNGIAWGSALNVARRFPELWSQWSNRQEIELLEATDPEVAPYLAYFPEAYEVVAIDPNKTTTAYLSETWRQSYLPKELEKELNQQLNTMALWVTAAAVFLLGTAGIGRRVQGLRSWQRWLAVASGALGSVESAAFLGMLKAEKERYFKRLEVRQTLGPLMVAEILSKNTPGEELIKLLQNKEVDIGSFYAKSFGSELQEIQIPLRHHHIHVKQDSSGLVKVFRSR